MRKEESAECRRPEQEDAGRPAQQGGQLASAGGRAGRAALGAASGILEAAAPTLALSAVSPPWPPANTPAHTAGGEGAAVRPRDQDVTALLMERGSWTGHHPLRQVRPGWAGHRPPQGQAQGAPADAGLCLPNAPFTLHTQGLGDGRGISPCP